MIAAVAIMAVLSPSTAVIAVEFTYNNSASFASVAPGVYLAHGPDYGSVVTTLTFYVEQTGTPPNVANGSVMYLNTTMLSSDVVLQVNNTFGHTVDLWVNGTLPTGVTMYFNTSTAWVSGSEQILGAKNAPALNISFAFTLLTGTYNATLYFDYMVSPGVFVIYTYPTLGQK